MNIPGTHKDAQRAAAEGCQRIFFLKSFLTDRKTLNKLFSRGFLDISLFLLRPASPITLIMQLPSLIYKINECI